MVFSASETDERVLDAIRRRHNQHEPARRPRHNRAARLVSPPARSHTSQRKNWKISGGGYGIHWPKTDEVCLTYTAAARAVRVSHLSKLGQPVLRGRRDLHLQRP